MNDLKTLDLSKITVSVFNTVSSAAETISLLEVINRHSQGYYPIVTRMREYLSLYNPGSAEWTEAKRQWKKTYHLPCWTPSCRIKDGFGRSDANIEQQYPIVAIDIDAQDQPSPLTLNDFKQRVSQFSYVFYAGLSCSGAGYFALCYFDSDDPARDFKAAYRQIAQDFTRAGYVVDTTASSRSNFRFVSYDPQPYVNLTPKSLTPSPSPSGEGSNYSQEQKSGDGRQNTSFPSPDEEGLGVRLILEQPLTGISDSYEDWYQVGFAFVDTFGEAGRELFHLFSSKSAKYRPEETDRKYTSLLRSSRHTHTLATFYYVLEKHGVSV